MSREQQEGRFFGKPNEFLVEEINRCKAEIDQSREYMNLCLNQISQLQCILAKRAVEVYRKEDTFRCEACGKDFPESEIGEVHDPVNGGLFCESCSAEWIAAMAACEHKWDGDGTIERSCEKCGKYETPEDTRSAK